MAVSSRPSGQQRAGAGDDPGASAASPSPLAVGARTALTLLIVLVVVVAARGFDVATLVVPGSLGVGGEAMIEDFGADSVPDGYAYDGQPLYVVAREFPDVEAMWEQGVADFRMNRVLQGALSAWAPHGAPLMIVLSMWGVLGAGLAAGSLADLASRHGRDPRVGYGAAVALAFPVAITTSEPLAFGLGLLGLALADRDRLGFAAVAFGMAGLARETALAMAVAAALVLLWRRRPLAALGLGAASVAPFLAWSSYVRSAVERSSQNTSELFGFLDLPDAVGPGDLAVSGLAIALMAVAVVAWRDVPALCLTALAYLGATGLYIGDQFRFHGLIRVSAAAVALGVAALIATALGRTDTSPSVSTSRPPPPLELEPLS